MKQAGDWSAEHVANSLQNRHIPRLSLYTPPSCPWSPMIKGPPMLEACTKNWSSVYKKRRFSLSFYIAFDTAYFGEITYSFNRSSSSSFLLSLSFSFLLFLSLSLPPSPYISRLSHTIVQRSSSSPSPRFVSRHCKKRCALPYICFMPCFPFLISLTTSLFLSLLLISLYLSFVRLISAESRIHCSDSQVLSYLTLLSSHFLPRSPTLAFFFAGSFASKKCRRSMWPCCRC